MLRTIEIVRDLHHLRAALAGPMRVDPTDRLQLEHEIDELEQRLDALRQGLPEDYYLVEMQAQL